jgi:hypothetical protein
MVCMPAATKHDPFRAFCERRLVVLLMVPMFAGQLGAEEAPPVAQVVEPPASTRPQADEVISRSKQFRISGGDSLVRASVALLADEAKDELHKLTIEDDSWKIPVKVVLTGKAGDPLPPRTVSMRLWILEGVPQLQIDVHLSRGIEQEHFKRTVTAALLYERVLRDRAGDALDHPFFVSPWLSDGLREASMWSLNLSDRRLYEALFKQGGLFKIEEMFALGERAFDQMDAAMRVAFRVSSGALVMALLEQPQGREGFRSFLNEVGAYEGEMPVLLRKHFPELNLSGTSLAKWWTLQLANKGGLNQLTDVLAIRQTEANLAEALRLNFRDAEGIVQQKEIDAWPELAELKEGERLVAGRPAAEALVHLSYRCFPSYRPILQEYQQVLDAISKNQTETVAARLASLAETRKTMLGRADRGRDYLDWFEITRARQTSGAFDDYLQLKERLKERQHQRKDPVSEYLDRMDRIFYREVEKPLSGDFPPE